MTDEPQRARGKTDHLENKSEHDLLLILAESMKHLCEEHAETKQTLKDFMKKIDTRCEETYKTCHREIVGKKTFWTIIGFVFAGVVLICGSISLNSISTSKNSMVLLNHEKEINLLSKICKYDKIPWGDYSSDGKEKP